MKKCSLSSNLQNRCLRGSYTVQGCFRKQVGRTFKVVNPKHEDWLKIFSKYLFLLFKYLWYKIMEYDVNRIKFVKTQKQNMSCKQANIFFKYVLIAFFTIIFSSRLFFHYVLRCSVKCFICSIALHLLSQILDNTIDFYKWKLKLIWSCKWIIWKRITEHTCWSIAINWSCKVLHGQW